VLPETSQAADIDGLESTLREVEPIFRDGAFAMPSFQEVLTARQFADEINAGRLSVRDAYEQFWSYEEDAELWDLPRDREWRALLLAWRPVLTYMAQFLISEKAEEFVDVISDGYFRAEKELKTRKRRTNYYNPFLDELLFLDTIGFSHNKKVSWVKSFREEYGHLEGIRFREEEMADMYEHSRSDWEEEYKQTDMESALKSDDIDTVIRALMTLAYIGKDRPEIKRKFFPKLIELIDTDNFNYGKADPFEFSFSVHWHANNAILQMSNTKEDLPFLLYAMDRHRDEDHASLHRVYSIHQRLKPQGYVAQKRLVA